MHPNFAPVPDSLKDEETKMTDDLSDVMGELELCQCYQNAVECLVDCDNVITNLQEELTSKNDLIASLEEKIVRMSLELATSKAFEDEHRSRRRVSNEDPCWDSRPTSLPLSLGAMSCGPDVSWLDESASMVSVGSGTGEGEDFRLYSSSAGNAASGGMKLDRSESSTGFNLVRLFRKDGWNFPERRVHRQKAQPGVDNVQ